jgi:hypothetical protein
MARVTTKGWLTNLPMGPLYALKPGRYNLMQDSVSASQLMGCERCARSTCIRYDRFGVQSRDGVESWRPASGYRVGTLEWI